MNTDCPECTAIAALVANEGASVTIFCGAADFGGSSSAIGVTDDWTGWEPRTFYGDEVLDCLHKAMAEKKARASPKVRRLAIVAVLDATEGKP